MSNHQQPLRPPRQELWEKRQLLYRLYDLQNITAWKARDLLIFYELFEEYRLEDILTNINGNGQSKSESIASTSTSTISTLMKIKEEVHERILHAHREKDFKAKAILTKKLDKLLTIIALIESGNKEGLTRLVSMYKLLKRYNELREALEDLSSSNNHNGNEESNDSDNNNDNDKWLELTDAIRQELEREIIELKKATQ